MRITVAAISLLLTWLFFFEYIPPNKRVHVWSDIEGYHYPLLNYAHKSIRNGRIPLWDPWIYSGIPFAGNIQAGLFYPPNWLLYAANYELPARLRGAGGVHPDRHGMRFTSIEILAFVHVWLAFLFTWLWLRERTAHWLPPLLGGMAGALGGYSLSQMNHLGVMCGYAWFPFALWGVEQANRQRHAAPLWKVAIGAALCLFAGYPPTWLALCIVVAAYAASLPWRTRLLPLVCAALALSVVVGAVQLLPVMEAAKLKTPENFFGTAIPFGREIYASLLLPNYFDQNRTNEGPEVSDGDYLYLGIPAIFGLIWLLRRGWYAGAGPALAIAGAVLFLAADPTGLVLRTIEHLPIVPDLLRRYNLVAGLQFAAALLAASAADDFLGRATPRRAPGWLRAVWAAALAAWCAYLFWLWPPGGPEFAAGFSSLVYPAVMVGLFAMGLYVFRRRPGVLVAGALLAGVFIDYKVFATNRRFNAVDGNVDQYWRGDARLGGHSIMGLDDAAYHEMLRHPGYRLAIQQGLHSTDMRHYGIATLQGFDPFLPDQYKAAVERFVPFQTNRLFEVDPLKQEMLRFFGVRWVMTVSGSDMTRTLENHPRFRKLPPGKSYYSIFEYVDAEPAWRFDGPVQMTAWEPERRTFRVKADHEGQFVLREQFFPGWEAAVDGAEAANERADGTFQSVKVPPGEHVVEFRYRPASVYNGALVSAAGLAGALVLGSWNILRKR